MRTTAKGMKTQEARYGYVLEDEASKATLTRFAPAKGTPNQIEILCLIDALGRMKKTSEIVIYTESWYVSNGIEELPKWEANNWINAKGKEIANVDLWQQYKELSGNHTITARIGEQHEYRNWLKDELHRSN